MVRLARSTAILCAVLSIARLAAQVNASGTFSGQVTDPGGAGVPNAIVKVTGENTGVTVTRTTGLDGYYTVPLLKAGIYSIEVSAPGFSTGIAKNLTLDVAQVATQDFKLQVGAIQQQVNVESTAPLLNTESQEVSSVITQTSIEQLPLNGRNFSQLALLVPGTTPGPVGGIRQTGGGNETKRDGAEITTSGGRGSFNMFMIDGLDDRDQVVGTTWAAFFGSDEQAEVAGDVAMLSTEITPVLKALRAHGLNIVAIHHHMTATQPDNYFLHYWGTGPAEKLGAGFKAALDELGKGKASHAAH